MLQELVKNHSLVDHASKRGWVVSLHGQACSHSHFAIVDVIIDVYMPPDYCGCFNSKSELDHWIWGLSHIIQLTIARHGGCNLSFINGTNKRNLQEVKLKVM